MFKVLSIKVLFVYLWFFLWSVYNVMRDRKKENSRFFNIFKHHSFIWSCIAEIGICNRHFFFKWIHKSALMQVKFNNIRSFCNPSGLGPNLNKYSSLHCIITHLVDWSLTGLRPILTKYQFSPTCNFMS